MVLLCFSVIVSKMMVIIIMVINPWRRLLHPSPCHWSSTLMTDPDYLVTHAYEYLGQKRVFVFISSSRSCRHTWGRNARHFHFKSSSKLRNVLGSLISKGILYWMLHSVFIRLSLSVASSYTTGRCKGDDRRRYHHRPRAAHCGNCWVSLWCCNVKRLETMYVVIWCYINKTEIESIKQATASNHVSPLAPTSRSICPSGVKCSSDPWKAYIVLPCTLPPLIKPHSLWKHSISLS